MSTEVLDPFRRLREFTTTITLLPIGNAPRIQQKYTISGTSSFAELRRYLRQAVNADDVHLYVNNQFEPMEDQFIGDFAKMFAKKHTSAEGVTYTMSVYYSIGRAYV